MIEAQKDQAVKIHFDKYFFFFFLVTKKSVVKLVLVCVKICLLSAFLFGLMM